MKYYLLTFNQDWADEHDVPALACFNQEEYDAWSKTPAGKVNKNYEKQLEAFNAKVTAYKDWESEYRKYMQTPKDTWPKEFADKPRPEYVNEYHDKPKKASSYIHARLGNSGDSFGEYFSDCLVGEDFITNKFVKKTIVDESFYNTFKKARLSDLSLCNVFELDEYEDWDDEEDEEEDD